MRARGVTPFGRSGLALRAKAEHEQAEENRRLIAEARANGVTTELVGDRLYTILHLPGPEQRPAPARVPIVSHRTARPVGLPG